MTMEPEIIVASITSVSSLLVAVISIIMNNRVLGYKVEELKGKFDKLTEKVEEHNHLNERIVALERDSKTMFLRIDEIRSEIRELRKELSK